MPHQVTKVGMIILLQSDLNEAVEFYQKLGLKLKFHLKDQWAELMLGEVKIGLCPTTQELPERHAGVVLEVENLQDTYNELKETIPFVNEPMERVHGIMVGIKDPGNNMLDLYQPTPEKVAEMAKQKAQEGCCKDTGKECACKHADKSGSCKTKQAEQQA